MKRKNTKRTNYIQKFVFVLFLIFIAGILLNIYMNVEINNYAVAEEKRESKMIAFLIFKILYFFYYLIIFLFFYLHKIKN